MKFGHFDDSRKEYIITVAQTPYPWVNYLGNKDFFSLITNTCGGYCFFRDARLRRIIRYRYNNIPADNGGRCFYIRENDDFWSPGWKPVKRGLTEYQCRHGMGYTVIKGVRNGLAAEALYFVPLNDNCEIHKLTLTNTTDKAKKFSILSYVEFCLWDAMDDMTNFQRNLNTGEVEIEGSVIYHKTEYRERRNHFAFYSVNRQIAGFDTDRESFIGRYNGLDNPDVVADGKARNSIAEGWSPIGSHWLNISLLPRESTEIIFVLGYVENDPEDKWESGGVINKKNAREMINNYLTIASVNRAFEELRVYWAELLSKYNLESNDDKLNRMVNIWNQYQCIVTFNLARSASLFESGIGSGIGFRDSNQDIAGFVHLEPKQARARILDLASIQFEDGGTYHQYQPLIKKGDNEIGGNFNDDPLWLIYSVAAYVKETGDWSILEERVPFESNPLSAKPLLDHLSKSFYHVVNNRGPHGLPLIGRADWNDSLNLNCFSSSPDESFQTCTIRNGKTAESVLIAAMFVSIGREYVKILQSMGREKEAQIAYGHIEQMIQVIKKQGWDGEWFLRAYDSDGKKVGSSECEEGKIFVEPQGYCVMAGVGVEEGLAQKAIESVRKYLDSVHGVVMINPAYSNYCINLGEITSYPPGYKENGGIFCHNNAWIIIAETILGQGDNAFEHYKKITPAYREEISELHKTEPYVYPQMIAGKDAKRHGEAKNSWLTGTAAWNFVTISQWILGIRPDFDGLIVEPCIPSDWNGYTVIRKFRGSVYRINVKNPSHVCKGVKTMIIDGVTVKGNTIPVFTDGKIHEVEAILG